MTAAIREVTALVERLLELPEPQRSHALDALREIVDEPYELSTEELAILRPALDEARHGENLTDLDTDDLLTKPWG